MKPLREGSRSAFSAARADQSLVAGMRRSRVSHVRFKGQAAAGGARQLGGGLGSAVRTRAGGWQQGHTWASLPVTDKSVSRQSGISFRFVGAAFEPALSESLARATYEYGVAVMLLAGAATVGALVRRPNTVAAAASASKVVIASRP